MYGTDPHKLHHTDAPATEVEAAHSVDTVTDEQRVHALIVARGWHGLTIKEAAVLMQKTPNMVSGRFTALQAKGLIVPSSRRRERSRVMVASLTNAQGSVK